MPGAWTIVDYGNPDFVNILDEWGGKVAWQVHREHAERIMDGLVLLVASESDDALDEEDDVLAVFGDGLTTAE